MKFTALLPITACLLSLNAFAADYFNGQAARLIIGQATFTDQYPGTTSRLLGAVGGVAYANDTLFFADSNRVTGLTPQNRRVLIYNNISTTLPSALTPISAYKSRCPVCTGRDDFPFTFNTVLGQPDFTKSDPAVTQTGMRLPTAVASDGKYLVVADTENNRVLIWNTIPASSNVPADVVLGQANFTTVHQPIVVDAKSFRGPQGVWIQNGRLFVADTQNHRVLIYNSMPSANNAAADIVLGQPNFTSAVEPDLTKITQSVHANTLLNPASVTSDGTHVFVADLGYSRVLIWNSMPSKNQQPADVVVGQPDMDTEGENNSAKLCPSYGNYGDASKTPIYAPRCEFTLDFPRFALSDGKRLYISDSGNDRVLVYNTIPTTNGAPADVVLGQPDFQNNQITSLEDIFTPNLARSAANIIPMPLALAWDGSSLYVADPTDRRVLVFSPADIDVPIDGVRNAASLQIYALSVVSVSIAPAVGDIVTITINSTDYKFTTTTTSVGDLITGLVAAINKSNNGAGDPNVLAVADIPFNSIGLTSRLPGDPGFAVTIATATSNTTSTTTPTVVVVHTQSNASTQSAQRIAPGTLVTIFGKNLSVAPVSAPTGPDGQPISPLPLELGGVQVYFDGNRAPILSVSPTQINTQVPFEVLDTNSLSAWVRTVHSDGTPKVSAAVNVPITLSNPGIFALPGDEPRKALAFHSSSQATASISIDGGITANDSVTLTIEDRTYTYTVVAGDTLAVVRDKLIQLINGNADEKVTAEAAGTFTRIILRAKVSGPDGNGIPIKSGTNTGAAVILTASQSATCCASVKGAPITDDNPAQPGETIAIYGTGLGLVMPEAGKQGQNTGIAYDGPVLNDPVEFVSSLVGGRTANVISAGAKLGAIGIYEVLLELNTGLATNPLTQVTIAQNIYTSNIVTIPVLNPTPPSP